MAQPAAPATTEKQPFPDCFMDDACTAQVLQILAKLQPSLSKQAPPLDTNEAASSLISRAYHQSHLFNDLTQSIYWNTCTQESLEKHKNLINTYDGYHKSCLNYAILQHDFVLVQRLITLGAEFTCIDKQALEIVLLREIEVASHIIDKICEAVPQPLYDQVADYLCYLFHTLRSSKQAHADAKNFHIYYRNCLRDPFREHGTALDTHLIYQGVASSFGLAGPTLDYMTDHLQALLLSLPTDNVMHAYMSDTAAGLTDLSYHADYIADKPLPNCGEAICQRILENLSSQTPKITWLPSAVAGHPVMLAVAGDKLIYANLNSGNNDATASQIYQIKHSDNITPAWVQSLLDATAMPIVPQRFYQLLAEVVAPAPIFAVQFPMMQYGNAAGSNFKVSIYGILLIRHMATNHLSFTPEDLQSEAFSSVMQEVSSFFIHYYNHYYTYACNRLIADMKDKKINRLIRYQCALIALEYINNHHDPSIPGEVQRALALRDVLELLGLGDLYQRNVDVKAALHLHSEVVHVQELIAQQARTLLTQQVKAQLQQALIARTRGLTRAVAQLATQNQ